MASGPWTDINGTTAVGRTRYPGERPFRRRHAACRYSAEVLGAADLASLVATLPATGLAALLCVETDAAACHRSLITDRLGADHDLAISHLHP